MEVDKQRIAELVRKVQSGDNSAFEELYRLTSKRAFFVALHFTKNDDDAEDILQESYVKALSKIKELDKPESFSSWLNQIVANKSKDFLKKKKPMLFEAEENEVFEVLSDEDTSFDPEENLDQTELQKTVMEVLDELSEEKRACILMMYFEELSVGEIAETLEIPEGTVKTRLFSARKDLKDKFAKRGITSTFSVAPIGVVIWAMRRMSDAVSKTFVGSGASAKVFADITAAGASTAAGAAVAGTTAVTTAAAVGTSTATATGAATTGTGIAAKIAAMTVAQKVIAGVSVAAVVAGGTVGVVTVANDDDKKDGISTTAYTEEYTTAPSLETTFVIDAMATVEFSETRETSSGGSIGINKSTSNSSSTKPQSTTGSKTAVNSTKATTKSAARTTTQKPSTTKKQTTTVKATTTKKQTTTNTATQEETTTQKVTTTKSTTTEKQTTTTIKATTETTTSAPAKVIVQYQVGEDMKTYTTTVAAGEQITAEELSNKMCSELGLSYVFFVGGDFPDSAESGVTYTYQADAVE